MCLESGIPLSSPSFPDAPRRAQDVDAVLRVVPHEVEGGVAGQPLAHGGQLARGEQAVQVAGEVVRNLKKARDASLVCFEMFK